MSIIEELKKYKKVIIYGAGDVGSTVVQKLLCYPEIKLYCIAVSSYVDNPYHILGKPVISIEELQDLKNECIVFIATKEKLHDEIKRQLLEYGFNNICYMSDELYNKWNETKKAELTDRYFSYVQKHIDPYLATIIQLCDDYQIKSEKKIRKYIQQALFFINRDELDITRIAVVLGTKCSLRCKECNNLMPYFKPQYDFELDEILESLELILNCARTVLRCELIGGEPFLSKNLVDVLEFLLKKKNVYQIEITTNGQIIPDDSLVPLLKNRQVKVRISDYGSLVDKKKMIRFLTENGIYHEVLEIEDWISPGDINKRNRSKELLAQCYNKCPAAYYCKTLFGRKLFLCARAASLSALGYMDEKEYILVNEKISPEEINMFFLKNYSEACDYCDIGDDNRIYVKPAEQF